MPCEIWSTSHSIRSDFVRVACGSSILGLTTKTATNNLSDASGEN